MRDLARLNVSKGTYIGILHKSTQTVKIAMRSIKLNTNERKRERVREIATRTEQERQMDKNLKRM